MIRLILVLLNSIIFIGEITQALILLPLKIILFILRFLLTKTKEFLHAFKKIEFKYKPIFKKRKIAKISFLKLPKISFKLPRIKIRNRFLRAGLKVKFFVLGCIFTLLIVFFYQSYFFVKNLPSPLSIGKVNYPLSTHIFDRNGKLLYEIYREQNRTPINLKDLPLYIAQATIAIEDKDFYHHNGIDFISGILRAVRDTIFSGSLQGGSTITQQLVRSSLLTPERTIQRKIKEIILALWTERLYSKNQILEMYLNQVPYGGESYGIEEAARTYFGKGAKDIDLSEAATLAGLPRAPSQYSPYINPSLTLVRRNEVLGQMYNQHYITRDQEKQAEDEALHIVPPKTQIAAPHFVFYVKSALENTYGIEEVEQGGLNVETTLDINIQNEAEKILNEELTKIQNLHVTNGAIMVTRPSTGEILAMVGSVNFFASPSGSFNVATALRQPGSSIKPIMYSLALANGYTAASIIDDSPVVFNSPGSSPYAPVNYDGKFHGKIPLRYALANSINVPAVKVLNTLGVPAFIEQAQKFGITTWTDPARYGLSLTLGGGEVKMTDMAEAYGVFANMGYKVPLNSLIKVSDVTGQDFYDLSPKKSQVIDPGIAYILSDILSDNFARQMEFGTNSALEIPGSKVAVKTGTTNDKRDNWTIGYTPDFLVVVWVGNNDNSPMNQYLASGITGAAPIWNRVMGYLLQNYSTAGNWYNQPDDVVSKKCYFGRTEYFLRGTENKVSCGEPILGSTPTPTPKP